jgi:alpha-ketoglutarate-dependent 2,4-dichlorophenoxyacetate dioxygenase
MMEIRFKQVGPGFAAEVEGLDLTQPLSAHAAAQVHAGMDEHAVLVFRGQTVSDEQHLEFSLALGTLEPPSRASLRAASDNRLEKTFADVSNLDRDDQPFAIDDRRRLFAIGNRLWHSDSSFKVVPAKYSILRAVTLPSDGGDTEFADMRAAYDALDEDTKAQVEDLVCEHSQLYSRQQIGFFEYSDEERARFAPVRQTMVRTLAATGRRSIYLSSHAGGIVGWPVPEARIFLRDLIEQATERQRVYRHQWRTGDIVMWDNRQTMHRARPFPVEQPRDMRRTTLMGDGPTTVQAPVEDAQRANHTAS